MSRPLAGLLILVACSSHDGGSSVDGPAQMMSSEGVTITAANVHQVSKLDDTPPAQGHYLVVLDMTLSNTGTKPAMLNPAEFSLETSAGIAFIASALTAAYTEPCDASASVEPAATATCGLAFEVDSTSLSKLIYTLADDSTATVSVSLTGSGSGSDTGGGWGVVCDASHTCSPGFECQASGSGYKATCELTCGSDAICTSTYTGSGTTACFGQGSDSEFCVVSCTGGTNQCPGMLVCDDTNGSAATAGESGFCGPPMD